MTGPADLPFPDSLRTDALLQPQKSTAKSFVKRNLPLSPTRTVICAENPRISMKTRNFRGEGEGVPNTRNSQNGTHENGSEAYKTNRSVGRRSESTLGLERASRAFRCQTVPTACLLCLGSLRTVGPVSAEQVSLMFFGHGGETQHAHGKEDQEENDGYYENWHTSPLRPFWNATARHAVIAVTTRCEGQTRAAPFRATTPGVAKKKGSLKRLPRRSLRTRFTCETSAPVRGCPCQPAAGFPAPVWCPQSGCPARNGFQRHCSRG